LSQKRQFFRRFFWRKYLKNHNIGPRSDPRHAEDSSSRAVDGGGGKTNGVILDHVRRVDDRIVSCQNKIEDIEAQVATLLFS
jgi:hypothetical protein